MSADAKMTGRVKPIHCAECDAVIGYVVQRNRVRRLLLFAPDSAVVMAEIRGDADVHCQCCGAVRRWWENR